MLRSVLHDALLVRDPSYCQEWIPALRCIVKNAAPRPGNDDALAAIRDARSNAAT
jgi:hypothetical protein